ncbi:MAG: GNAT family N-acetyltransferase [Bacteroidales bacterium]|nr:GNAT family N-acetyltransferase [Bacteroidales bacterium]
MNSILNQEKRLFFAKLIRQNHFSLYKNLVDFCSFEFVNTEHYSAIKTNLEWPNMIYNLDFRFIKTTELLQEISQKIKMKELPNLLLIDSIAKPDDFDIKTRKHGILPVMRWPGMIFDLEYAKTERINLPDFEIRKVDDLNLLTEWISISNRNFFTKKGLDATSLQPIMNAHNIRLFLGIYQKTPASAILINQNMNTSGIYIASTLPEFTGKGFMSALVGFSIAEAVSEGFEYCLLEATRQSYHLYTNIGFQNICNFDIYWKPDELT